MAFHERSRLTICPLEFEPLFFRLYIDDCFIFRFRNHVRPFLDYLKSQHPNITFTNAVETDSTLPLLDTLIDRSAWFSHFGLSGNQFSLVCLIILIVLFRYRISVVLSIQ